MKVIIIKLTKTTRHSPSMKLKSKPAEVWPIIFLQTVVLPHTMSSNLCKVYNRKRTEQNSSWYMSLSIQSRAQN